MHTKTETPERDARAKHAAASSVVASDAGLATDASPPPPAVVDAGARAPLAYVECTVTQKNLVNDLLNQPDCHGRCGVHGTCPTSDPETGPCTCDLGYTGDRCQSCAAGFVEPTDAGSQLRCVTPCEAQGAWCNGTCEVMGNQARCRCAPGYVGENCLTCAPGFAKASTSSETSACLPTCNDNCDPTEECALDADGLPICKCLPSYARGADDNCAFEGLMADAEFDYGCAAWSLAAWPANAGVATAVVGDGELKLAVSNRCSAVFASTRAWIPVADTVAHAAFEIEAMGSPGARLGLSTDYPPNQLAPVIVHPTSTVVGTGKWERYTVCMPNRPGEIVPFAFMLGESGTCAEQLDFSFAIRSVAAVSQPACPDLVRREPAPFVGGD